MIPGLQQEAEDSLSSKSTVSFSTTNLLHADYITDARVSTSCLHRHMVYALDQYLKLLVHLSLGAFAKLQRRLSSVMPCPSVPLSTCLLGTSQLLLDRLSIFYIWIFFFENLSRKFKFH